MPCYRPLQGWRSRIPNSSGRRSIVFNISDGYRDLPVSVPCGQCIGCRLDKSRQWAIRCVHEAKQNVYNSFVTLTYDDEHLPEDGSLSKKTLQNFIKRLRKEIDKDEPGKKIRYYACGEYGERGNRPHYHAIIFGHDFSDKEYIGQNAGHKLYTSNKLSDVWGKGFCSIGNVTFDSAAYVARYCTKKITGEQAEKHYAGKCPEFSLQSTGRESGGGIGGYWFTENAGDYERAGGRIVLDKGIAVKPARYYEKIYESIKGGDSGNKYKSMRKKVGKRLAIDNTPDRLEVKERIQLYSLKQINQNKGGL